MRAVGILIFRAVILAKYRISYNPGNNVRAPKIDMRRNAAVYNSYGNTLTIKLWNPTRVNDLAVGAGKLIFDLKIINMNLGIDGAVPNKPNLTIDTCVGCDAIFYI